MRSIEKLQKTHGKLKREYETPAPLDQNVMDSIKTLSSMKIREILRYNVRLIVNATVVGSTLGNALFSFTT